MLWSHYANCHKGFCIGLNKIKLTNSKLFGSYGPIIYNNKVLYFNSSEQLTPNSILIETLTKALDWGYKKEYRFIKLFDSEPTDNERKFFIPDDFFEEIILGLKISKNDADDIIKIAKTKKVPVYKIEKQKKFLLYKFKV